MQSKSGKVVASVLQGWLENQKEKPNKKIKTSAWQNKESVKKCMV